MRRSPLDVRLGRWLQIGQQWRARIDGSMWRVHQVHRRDCLVELTWCGGRARLCIPFERLRNDFTWIATPDHQEAA